MLQPKVEGAATNLPISTTIIMHSTVQVQDIRGHSNFHARRGNVHRGHSNFHAHRDNMHNLPPMAFLHEVSSCLLPS
ncbi:hypothetical protein ACSQ67_024744 [Phaseolus vulgaris]